MGEDSLGRPTSLEFIERACAKGKFACRKAMIVRSISISLATILALSLVSVADARNQEFTGESLVTPLVIDLDFQDAEYVLIRVSQDSADYAISLFENASGQAIQVSSLGSYQGLDDVMLVAAEDCNDCAVRIEGLNLVDQSNSYRVTTEDLNSSSSEQGQNLNVIAALKVLTEIGQLHYSIEGQNSQHEKQEIIDKTIEGLSLVQNIEHHRNVDYWRFFAMTHLANIYDHYRSSDSSVEILQKILDESKNQKTSIRRWAKFELIPHEQNHSIRQKRYLNLIEESEKNGDHRLIAEINNRLAQQKARDGQHHAAIALFEDAYREQEESRRFSRLFPVLYNLSWAHLRNNNIPKALELAGEYQEMSLRYQRLDDVVRARYALGTIYGRLGDHDAANKFLDQALEDRKLASGEADKTTTRLNGHIHQEKSKRYLSYGNLSLAKVHAEEMLRLFDKSGWKEGEADAVFLLGEIAFANDEVDDAKEKFLQVIKFDGANNRFRSQGKSALRLAELEMSLNDQANASAYITLAIERLKDREDLLALSQAIIAQLAYFNANGDYQKAEVLVNRARETIELHGRQGEKIDYFFEAGRSAAYLNKIGNAEAHFSKATKLTYDVLDATQESNLRQSYLAKQKRLFEARIELMMRSNSSELKALKLLEEFRARTLVESLRQVNSTAPQDIDIKRKEIYNKLIANASSWIAGNIEQEGFRQNSAFLNQELHKTNLSQNDRHVATVGRQILNPWSGSVNLRPDELLVYYFIGTKKSWVWLLSDSQIDVVPLPDSATIERKIEPLLAGYSVPPVLRNSKGGAFQLKTELQQLSDILIGPIQSVIEDEQINKTVIVPDGVLNRLSFAMLQSSQMDEPLISKVEISYAHSIAVRELLLADSENTDVTTTSALIIADPINERIINGDIERLSASAADSATIAELLNNSATILQAADANKTNVVRELNENYTILHLATHGFFNAEQPSLSGLLLSSIDGDDMFWLAPEISSSRIDSELVFLSACESSSGKNISGEGLLSLSRSFIEAGANQVVGTMWKIQDKVSSALSNKFYKYLLAEHHSASKALQKAQLEIASIDNGIWSDPYYWAAFQIQGASAYEW